MTMTTPMRMRAFAIDHFGEPGRLRELALPQPGPAEVLVRIRAAGVNPLDWRVRDGGKLAEGLRFPLVLGQDAAGTVEAVGSDITGLSVGEEVFGAFWLAGTYAQFVCAPLSSIAIAPKPANIDFVHAAALPTPALAALAAVEAVGVNRGDTVLVVGATGGVGSYAVQIAAKRGAHVMATAHGEGARYLRRLGASETIDYRREDVAAAVKKMRPEGITAVIDVVSTRQALDQLAEAIRPGGRLATTIHAADLAALAHRGIQGVNIDVLGQTGGLDAIARLVEAGALEIPLARTLPLTGAAEALAEIEAGHARGKIVVSID